MWYWALDLLRESAVLRLFIVVAFGYLLGELRFPGNFRLGLAAVLFAGLAFGALDPSFVLPHEIQTVGLVLFVYCVGLEAGPGFVQSLRKDGLRLNLSMAAALLVAFALVWIAILFSGRSKEALIGLFCGALTNTPALGAVTESILRSTGDTEAANAAVVGYGLAYPVAVLVVLLLFQLRTARLARDPLSNVQPNTLPRAQTIEVRTTNAGQPWLREEIERKTGVVLTRCRRPSGKVELLHENAILNPGDLVVAVGSPATLQEALKLTGELATEPLEENLRGFEVHRYFVSNQEVVGRPIGEIGLEKLGAVLSRLRRADVDLSVSPETVLHLGDRVQVITYKQNEPAIRQFFGNSLTALSETGYFSFALGIALGIIVGSIPIPVPGLDQPITLGLAGGPLIVALLLGFLGRTGPFIWNPPLTISLTLRQLGILFFLACAGVKAGSVLPGTFKEHGLFLVAVGTGITLTAHLVLWGLLSIPTRASAEKVLGASSGMQTQPAVLTFAAQRLSPAPVNLAYATVYPLSIILKILLAQILLLVS